MVDKISEESTVSRILQQKVPVTNTIVGDEDISFDIKSRNSDSNIPTHITEHDTIDKVIYDNRYENQAVSYSEISIQEDANDDLTLKINKRSYRSPGQGFTESDIGSEKGEYNKIKVDIDREDHKFFFDWTPGNNRTFLSHPSNTYWFIDNSGNFTIKSTGDLNEISVQDKNSIITKDYNCLVHEDYNIQSIGNFRLQSTHTLLNSSGNLTLSASGNASTIIEKERKTIIGSNDITNIKGSKFDIINGVCYIKSNDFAGIILDAPNIELRSPSIKQTEVSNSTEDIQGKKKISASTVEISAATTLNLGAPMGHMQVQAMTLDEEITGPALPLFTSKTDGKKTTVRVGNYVVNTVLGDIILEAILGNKIEVTLGGDIKLTTPTGKLNVGGVTGITELDGSSLIKIGAGNEPAVLGIKLQQWLANHTHQNNTGGSGISLQSSGLLDTLSTKIFLE